MKCSSFQRSICCLTLFVLCGCRKKADQEHDSQISRHPNAAELFELESKCNVLGQKVLESNAIGSALTQSQVSKYNSADNRCYVLLDVTTANLQSPLQDFTSDEFLIDGQTGEQLATRYCKGRNCTANVLDDSLKGMVKDPLTPSESEVRDLMDSFVHTDRHLK